MASRPFGYGHFDCGLLLADWCFELRGIDPAASLRGRYEDAAGAHALAGTTSLPQLFSKLAYEAGIERTLRPRYGDVAMIRTSDGGLRGAIVTSGYIVIAPGGGLSRVSANAAHCLRAWSLHA